MSIINIQGYAFIWILYVKAHNKSYYNDCFPRLFLLCTRYKSNTFAGSINFVTFELSGIPIFQILRLELQLVDIAYLTRTVIESG